MNNVNAKKGMGCRGPVHPLAFHATAGRFFAAHRQRLRDVAQRLCVHHLANLGGCFAR
jgi:hypothetical protein